MVTIGAMVELSHDKFLRTKRPIDEAQVLTPERAFVDQRIAAIINAKPLESPAIEPRDNDRSRARLSVYKHARVFTSNYDCHHCVVVDLSADGARISINDADALPDEITLRFEKSGVRKNARIVWRHEGEAGLAFIKRRKKRAT